MKLNIIITSFLVIFLIISSGCFNTNDQIYWGTEDELEMHIELIDYSIYPGYDNLNFSVILLNISVLNTDIKTVYIENRLVFDINIDGVITDSNNNTFHINEYDHGFGISRLSIYADEGQRAIMDNILLSDNEEYTIRCWYEHEGIKVYSNEIIFIPLSWDELS